MRPSRTFLRIGLLLLGGMFLLSEVGLAVDANFNTLNTDLRSNGSDGNLGFDPCLGGSNVNGTCNSILSGVLLSTLTVGTGQTAGIFEKTGPGAVTDNMFGIIENPVAPLTCGTTLSDTTNEVGTNKLNCSEIRFNPISQGQDFHAGINTLTLNTPMVFNVSMVSDSCANPGTDCPNNSIFPATPATQLVAAHTGFSLTNNFTWTGLSTTTATVSSSQDVNQVTAVKTTGIGTFAAPGSGDQVVQIHTDFATTVGTPSLNDNTMPTGVTINWHQIISDPDQSGSGTAIFSQDIEGSFALNVGTFPTVQYPTGQSQSAGVTTGAAVNFP